MKTAMHELRERLLVDADIFPNRAPYVYEIIRDIDDELLEKEKQQIIDACYSGKMMQSRPADKNPEQYYNETFGEL